MPTLSQAPQCYTSIEDVKIVLHFVHCHLCREIVMRSSLSMNASGKNSSGKYMMK